MFTNVMNNYHIHLSLYFTWNNSQKKKKKATWFYHGSRYL